MYIRVGVGGGSGYEIHITTDDTNLYGYTITISKNGTTVGTTVFDNTGNASFGVDETGTYTVSVTYDGNTYSENVVVSAFEVELSAGFVLSSWLTAGDISGTYASLSDVLADEDAVRQLMTIHAAVDYLASFDSTDASVVAILNDNYAAKWISLTDYAMDVLEAAYGTLMGTIGKYGYGEWGITDATTTPPTWGALGNVPVMTSNTAPYGEAFGSVASSGAFWHVFDGVEDTGAEAHGWYDETSANPFVGYGFTNPCMVKKCRVNLRFRTYSTANNLTLTLQGCNEKNGTYTDVGSYTFSGESTSDDHYKTVEFDVQSSTYYLYYKIRMNQTMMNSSTNYVWFINVQFYGRALRVSVPKMSGNTTPYGTVDVTNYISGGSHAGFKALDGGTPSTSDHCWVGYDPNLSASYGGQSGPVSISYDFDNPVVVKQVSMKLADQSSGNGMEFTIDGYDGSEWMPLKSVAQKTSGSQTSFNQFSYDVDNNVAYTRYRLNITRFTGSAAAWGNASSANYWCAVVGALNFFGFDYSEREWDTIHPRRYLYDHGVEVETLDGSSFTVDTTYSITGNVKNPSDLELHSPSGNYSSSFGTNAMIDNSGGDYSLLFVNINQARLGTTPLIMSVATTKAAYTNNRLGLLNPSVPYSGSLQALDISNMLQSFYCVLDAPSNRWANVNEWWLE